MSGTEIAESLMGRLGFLWQTTPGKAQFPGEESAYYHLVRADDARVHFKFATLADLLAYLRESVQELEHDGTITRAGRKTLPSEQRRKEIRLFLLPATLEAIRERAQPKESIGATVDRIVREWAATQDIDPPVS